MHTHTTQEIRTSERTNFGVGNVHTQHTYFRRVVVTFPVCSNWNVIHWQLSKWQLVFSRCTSRRQWQLNVYVPFAHTFCIFPFDLKTTIGIFFSLWNLLYQPKVRHPHYYEWTRMFHIRCPNKLRCPFQVYHAWQKYAEWYSCLLVLTATCRHPAYYQTCQLQRKEFMLTRMFHQHYDNCFCNYVFYSISMIFAFGFYWVKRLRAHHYMSMAHATLMIAIHTCWCRSISLQRRFMQSTVRPSRFLEKQRESERDKHSVRERETNERHCRDTKEYGKWQTTTNEEKRR